MFTKGRWNSFVVLFLNLIEKNSIDRFSTLSGNQIIHMISNHFRVLLDIFRLHQTNIVSMFGLNKTIKERGGGQNFSTSFWMRFCQAPLCRYRFKVIFDDIIVLLSGNIIEYICFWRFNSIIMTWNKWLVFTKSVFRGLNNISPWPCPLCIVRLPCVITWLYSTPFPSCQPLV